MIDFGDILKLFHSVARHSTSSRDNEIEGQVSDAIQFSVQDCIHADSNCLNLLLVLAKVIFDFLLECCFAILAIESGIIVDVVKLFLVDEKDVLFCKLVAQKQLPEDWRKVN